jgi:cell wall assembly regulator SMI1
MAATSADQVRKAYGRIIAWATKHPKARAILPTFRKSASKAAIAAFEKKVKLKLPDGVVALYLLADGQDEEKADTRPMGGEAVESGLFPSIEKHDLAFLLSPLKLLTEVTPKTKRSSRMPGFRVGWVPIGDNFGGDNIVVDLASEDAKKRGRILQFNHEYGGAYEVAPSIEAFLTSIAQGLEKKTIVFDDDAGLTYKKTLDWDDLIGAGKVEYDPEWEKEMGA